jgi:two-component system sensor histidine kinase RegB
MAARPTDVKGRALRRWTSIIGLPDGIVRPADAAARPTTAGSRATEASARRNVILLMQLRWLAVAGQIITIVIVRSGFGVELPLLAMSGVICALVALNLVSLLWLRAAPAVNDHHLLIFLLFDVGALTIELYLSGGATNPFIFLYILQVTLAAVLLRTRPTIAVVVITTACFAGLVLYNRPLVLPAASQSDPFRLYINGLFVCFALDAALLIAFVTRIGRNLRIRDAHLAALRQHAIEEDHIVRMGLLASGAAHELGTPLASMSVILGDWRRMPQLEADDDLRQDIEDMQMAVARCKAILTGVLLTAGEARGEAPAVTTMAHFLDELVADWCKLRSVTTLHYVNAFEGDLAIVSDTALKQVVFNVLDNAYEVSPSWLSFTAERRGEMLELKVSDAGPGFSAEMLKRFGRPYQSTKGRPGGGLGLFLVVNVVRKLGGTVTPGSRRTGGAVVTIELPLETLMIGQEDHGG